MSRGPELDINSEPGVEHFRVLALRDAFPLGLEARLYGRQDARRYGPAFSQSPIADSQSPIAKADPIANRQS